MARLTMILITSLLLAGVARADDVEQAKQLYSRGRTAYNLNNYSSALENFTKAYEAHADPAFLFNIAQCERALGKYDEAERSYRAYLRESPGLPEQRVAEVKVLIGAMASAAQQQRANLPPPGTEPPHAVIPPPSPPQPQAAPSPPVAYTDTGKPLRIAGIVTADVGIGLVALGGVFAGLSYKAGQDAYHPSSGVYDHNADAQQTDFRTGEIVCFVVGGVAAVTGTTLWLIGRRRRETPTTRAALSVDGAGVRF